MRNLPIVLRIVGLKFSQSLSTGAKRTKTVECVQGRVVRFSNRILS